MAVTYPLEILTGFPGWSTEFDLFHRQELSRTAGGSTIAKDMGTPLWKAAFQSRVLSSNNLDIWRAKLNSLEGSLQRFMGRPMSRCYPIAHPNGRSLGNVSAVTVASITLNKVVTLNGAPADYKSSIGDYMQIGRHLYQIVGLEGGVEVRPHLAPGAAVGNSVVLVRPSVPMIIVPTTLSTTADAGTGRGTITFQAIESR